MRKPKSGDPSEETRVDETEVRRPESCRSQRVEEMARFRRDKRDPESRWKVRCTETSPPAMCTEIIDSVDYLLP